MSAYIQTVTATIDPCVLREHDWREGTFGLADLTKLKTCSRCGATSFPRFEAGGISRGMYDMSRQDMRDWLASVPGQIEP